MYLLFSFDHHWHIYCFIWPNDLFIVSATLDMFIAVLVLIYWRAPWGLFKCFKKVQHFTFQAPINLWCCSLNWWHDVQIYWLLIVLIAPYLDLIGKVVTLCRNWLFKVTHLDLVAVADCCTVVTCLLPRWYYASKEGHIRPTPRCIFTWPRGLNRFIPAPMKRVGTGP